MTTPRFLVGALLLGLFSSSPLAQTLPTSFLRTVDPESGSWVAHGLLSRNPSTWSRLRVGLSNEGGNSIALHWQAGVFTSGGFADFSTAAHEVTAEPTSFRPLTAAVEAGLGQAIYVAGWYDRTGECVVERWEFDNALISQTQSPSGIVVTFTPPTVTRRELYRGTATGPVYDIAFHPYSRELLLLADESLGSEMRALYTIDVDDSDLTPTARTDLSPANLQSRVSMKVGATGGSVYVFLFSVRDTTDVGQMNLGLLETHVLCDTDSDGTYELSYADTSHSISAMSDGIAWERNYTASAAP